MGLGATFKDLISMCIQCERLSSPPLPFWRPRNLLPDSDKEIYRTSQFDNVCPIRGRVGIHVRRSAAFLRFL